MTLYIQDALRPSEKWDSMLSTLIQPYDTNIHTFDAFPFKEKFQLEGSA